jgi:predicted esterase
VKNRPAIIWLHGGGFAVGIDSMYALANGTGKEYAQRGYVGFSVEYRTDTTLVGVETDAGRPPSLCQWVQDNENPGDPTWEARREQCKRNIIAAQHDIQGAVRWIRNHAAAYDVDATRIAVGGFSAGAVTSANLAYRSNDVGSIRYFNGDDLSVAESQVQAAIGASGCLYSVDGGPLTEVGAGDAPISFIHSKLDRAVPYECVVNTVTTARSKGFVAELTSYCTERGHAAGLYALHKASTDEQWTTFLARQLNIYSGMRSPSADPVCPPQ